jgi:hypothetical protein
LIFIKKVRLKKIKRKMLIKNILKLFCSSPALRNSKFFLLVAGGARVFYYTVGISTTGGKNARICTLTLAPARASELLIW